MQTNQANQENQDFERTRAVRERAAQMEQREHEAALEDMRRGQAFDREKRKNYDADKTMFFLSAIVLGLIFLAGTVLGSLDAIMRLGAIGALCVACYCILDLVGAWALIIDYNEDGTLAEKGAWIVKYIAGFVLLVIGGLVSFRMMQDGTISSQVDKTTGAYQKAYDGCIEKVSRPGPKSTAACQKVAESAQKGVSTAYESNDTGAKKDGEFANKILNFPLFHYSPGIIGILLLAFLSIMVKLSATRKRRELEREERLAKLSKVYGSANESEQTELPQAYESSLPKAYVSLREPSPRGNFEVPKESRKFHKGPHSKEYVRLVFQTSGAQVRDEANQYIGHLGKKKMDDFTPTYSWVMANMTPKKGGE